jgi:hypothetical protein
MSVSIFEAWAKGRSLPPTAKGTPPPVPVAEPVRSAPAAQPVFAPPALISAFSPVSPGHISLIGTLDPSPRRYAPVETCLIVQPAQGGQDTYATLLDQLPELAGVPAASGMDAHKMSGAPVGASMTAWKEGMRTRYNQTSTGQSFEEYCRSQYGFQKSAI